MPRCDIPIEPFSDLLIAFRQDQTAHRYATWDDVFRYCRYSANPVGRLVLYLCGYRDAERQRLSDATCTALQLANFWQDVTRDLEKGRIYIPLEALAAHGLTEEDIVERRFRRALRFADEGFDCADAELFAEGMPLAGSVDSALARGYRNVQPRRAWRCSMPSKPSGTTRCSSRPSIAKSKQFDAAARARFERVFLREPGALSGRSCRAYGAPAIVEGEYLASNVAADPTRVTDEVARSYAELPQIARASASNFYYAFFMLPQAKRDALCALYAFMRLVDDVSDTVGSAAKQTAGPGALARRAGCSGHWPRQA